MKIHVLRREYCWCGIGWVWVVCDVNSDACLRWEIIVVYQQGSFPKKEVWEPNTGAQGLANGGQGAVGARIEDWGAEGVGYGEGWGMGRGAFCTFHLKLVPTVKITLGTPFPGVPAGNDPWSLFVSNVFLDFCWLSFCVKWREVCLYLVHCSVVQVVFISAASSLQSLLDFCLVKSALRILCNFLCVSDLNH